MVTVHVGKSPEQPPPLQPPKVEGGMALAFRVTGVFSAKAKEQVDPQSMPTGSLVTVPLPILFTISV